MNKIPSASQNTEAKTLPADVCNFGRFGQLSLAAVQSTDSQFDSGVKWWIHVLSIVTYLCKNSFLLRWNSYTQCSESSTHCCFWSIMGKCCTHFEHNILIDKCSCKMGNTLPSDIFNPSTISRNFNLQLAKRVGVFQDNCWIYVTWAFSIICVCRTAFKVSIPPLSCCFQWSRVQITLIKPLLCLNSIFSHQKAMLYQQLKFRFFHYFENL